MTDQTNIPKFKSLDIDRNWKGNLRGKIRYEVGPSDIQLTLTEKQAMKLLTVVSETMVEAAKENADMLLHDVLEFATTKVIESDDEDEVPF